MLYKISSYEYPLDEIIEASSINEAMAKLFASHPIAKERNKKIVVIVEDKKDLKQLYVANGNVVPEDYKVSEVETKHKPKIETNNIEKESTKLQLEEKYSPIEVIIKDINMPFSEMVGFMVKWSLAAIPAALILSFVFFIIYVFLAVLVELIT